MDPAVLELPPLHVSLDPELGDYYQDFSAALRLVESGWHGGLDSSGVPWVRVGSTGRAKSAIITSQYALANLIAHSRGDDSRGDVARRQLDSLVETQERDGASAGRWLFEFDNPKYPWLRAGWTSALASGNALSALLRGREVFRDERYLEAAEAAYRGLHQTDSVQRLCEDDGRSLWYEEYPASPPLRVLNGHIYCLLGVLDYARVTGDMEAEARWRRAATTALEALPDFDLGYWSAYELRWKEPAALHYQKNIHVPQLRILAQLTGESEFQDVAARWERQAESKLSRLRWQAAIRIHGRRKRRSV